MLLPGAELASSGAASSTASATASATPAPNAFYHPNALTRRRKITAKRSKNENPEDHDTPLAFSALLVGEGNFSFAHSLLRVPDSVLSSYFGLPTAVVEEQELQLTATSFDTEAELFEKYPDFVHMKSRMHNFISLRHSVDAVNLQDFHAGLDEEVGEQRLRTTSVDRGAVIILTLVEGQGERWKVEHAAKKHGFRLASCAVLDASQFPGYECKRNKSGKSFKNIETKKQWRPGKRETAKSSEMISYVYRFVPVGDEGAGTRSEEVVEDARCLPCSFDPAVVFANQAVPAEFRNEDALQQHTLSKHPEQVFTKNRSAGEVEQLQDEFSQNVEALVPAAQGEGSCGTKLPSCPAVQQNLLHSTSSSFSVEQVLLNRGSVGAESHLVRDKYVLDLTLGAASDGYGRKRDQDMLSSGSDGLAAGEVVDVEVPKSPRNTSKCGSVNAFYSCGICGQAVPSHWSVHDHVMTLRPLLKLDLECDLCGKKFIEHRALRQHLNYCRAKRLS
eukprot:g4547.t1